MIRPFRRRIFLVASAVTATAAVAGCSPFQGLLSSSTAPPTTHSTGSDHTFSPAPNGTHSPGRHRTPSQSPTDTTAPPLSQTGDPTQTSPQTGDPTQTSPQTGDPTQTASQTGDPTQTASPTGTATGTAAPTASATQAGTVCVTSAATGRCQFGAYASITGTSANPYVDQNVWSPISGWKQTLHATDPAHWYVTANMAAGNTAVVSYPNTGVVFNKALSGFSSITSSFTDSLPQTSGANAEASYDIWLNNWSDEVMIQNDYTPSRGPACGNWTAKNVEFGGSNGVPAHPWDLCTSGSTAWWETADGNLPSGSVDVLAMLNWLVSHGHLPAGAQLGAVGYGFEISSTGGADENFQVSSYSIAAS
jgi:hypothetical protein